MKPYNQSILAILFSIHLFGSIFFLFHAMSKRKFTTMLCSKSVAQFRACNHIVSDPGLPQAGIFVYYHISKHIDSNLSLCLAFVT